jgi:hypothetical protein
MELTCLNIGSVYRNGLGAIVTSVACSLCTCLVSQTIIFVCTSEARTPEIQSGLSVAIFVFGYWAVYFSLRTQIEGITGSLRGVPLRAEPPPCGLGKLFFICVSEAFWIVSLGLANLSLLRHGFSAGAAAALSQWGINIFIWLPLLPWWEWIATRYVPAILRNRYRCLFPSAHRATASRCISPTAPPLEG